MAATHTLDSEPLAMDEQAGSIASVCAGPQYGSSKAIIILVTGLYIVFAVHANL